MAHSILFHSTSLLSRRIALWLTLAAVSLIGWLIYLPGLSGSFLFDDFANLPALGAYGAVDSWPTFWRYITSGTADPTGRPLALLTFLVDAKDWPADAYSFKRTNVILHLVNGLLLFVLLRQLARILERPEAQATIAAVVGMALWLLHPLLVSTILYIVQREAMLPGTFVLLGIIGYLAGRNLISQGKASGVALSAISLALGTLLAVLSKANGALLPLLIWILDATLLETARPLQPGRATRWFSWMRRALVILPSLLLLGYLAKIGWNGFVHGTPPHRPWSLGERLLTECRILIDYLALLWLPQPYTSGLFNDAVEVSTGLMRPWTTLLAAIAISGLLASAWLGRRRSPALAAAILFFFTGHLMESTVVTLELYYEHRNYIPAMLMFWPLALWLAAAASSSETRVTDGPTDTVPAASLRWALIVILPLGLAMLTLLRADLWGNVQDQALLWALRNPDSPRAQAYAAQMELAKGDATAAIARLEPMLVQNPNDIQAALNLVGAKCANGSLTTDDLERTAVALRNTNQFERMGYSWFERAIGQMNSPACKPMDSTAIGFLLQAAKSNPHAQLVRGRRQDLFHLEARKALMDGNAQRALNLFNEALDEDPRPGAALAQAALLGRSAQPLLGLRHLEHLERSYSSTPTPFGNMAHIHRWLLAKQGYWEHEVNRLKENLKEDAAPDRTSPASQEAG